MAKFFVNIDGELAEVGAGNSAYDLAKYHGFEGTEEEYLQSLKGKNGVDGKDGKNGTIVNIDPSNKHWMIDGNDSGISAEGKDGTNGTNGSVITMNPSNKHWLIDGVDSGVIAEGIDGQSPTIGSNGNWFLGTKDTGISANGKSAYEIAVSKGYIGDESTWIESLKGIDGKSIKSITKDENNNIIVTFTDNSTQNIGKLNVDVSADFLTEGGFGNLRYYQGKFQYYDKEKSEWIDASATPDKTFYMGLTPNSMKSFRAKYDTKENVIKLTFEEPDDISLEGQSICLVEKVVIRRKKDEIPLNIKDGIEVITIPRKNFKQYSKTPYIDNSFTPSPDEKWYYRAFPVSTLGIINNLEENNISLADDKTVYGFILDQNESNPENMISYIEENSNFSSAYMDYNRDVFKYADWGNAWFIKNLKPVMLKYDGSIAYELDKNDFSKKTNGEDSDISNVDFEGNAMIGIPKVYWKIVDNGDNTCNVYFSDQKVDEDFHCYSHIDNNGNEIDYCYMPIYNGSLDLNNKLRSISGKTPLTNQTGINEITYAKANNLTSDEIWNTEVYSDRILITLLLLLIGKSTDTQSVFGRGDENGSVLQTGTMNKKGLFYGTTSSSQGVKVFGIENYWGNIWRRTAGYVCMNSVQKIKMTYSKNDGATCIGYNTTGEGYLEIPNSTISSSNGGYINIMLFNKHGLFPKQISGSSSTFYTDGCWFAANTYALFGGSYDGSARVGALYVNLSLSVSYTHASLGCAVSCKPLA